MGEVPLYLALCRCICLCLSLELFLARARSLSRSLTFSLARSLSRARQGYLAHKKTPTPLGPPYDPRHRPTVGSHGGAVSYERGTPASLSLLDSEAGHGAEDGNREGAHCLLSSFGVRV